MNSQVEKLNIFAIYKSIIIIFSVNLPLVFIYKSRKKFNYLEIISKFLASMSFSVIFDKFQN